MNVSIVILAYNHEKFITECLNSIKYQQIKYNRNRKNRVQVIISNDASIDNTINIIHMWKEKNQTLFDDFIVLDNQNNIGTCASIINALSKCTGEYIKFLGGDDLFPPSSIFNIFSYLEKYDIIQGSPFMIYDNQEFDNNSTYKLLKKEYCIKLEEEKNAFYSQIHRYCFLNAPSTYVRKKWLMNSKVLDYVKTYKYTEDYPMWLKISEAENIKYKYIPLITCIYRRTSGSANIIKKDELHEERTRAYCYAYKTCTSLFGKTMLKNTISALKRGRNAPRLINISGLVKRTYYIKNCYKKSPFTMKEIKSTVSYIQKIQEMK